MRISMIMDDRAHKPITRRATPTTMVSLLMLLSCVLAGCEDATNGPQYVTPAQTNAYAQRCQAAGAPGTDAFVNCLMSLGLNKVTATQISTQYTFGGN